MIGCVMNKKYSHNPKNTDERFVSWKKGERRINYGRKKILWVQRYIEIFKFRL